MKGGEPLGVAHGGPKAATVLIAFVFSRPVLLAGIPGGENALRCLDPISFYWRRPSNTSLRASFLIAMQFKCIQTMSKYPIGCHCECVSQVMHMTDIAPIFREDNLDEQKGWRQGKGAFPLRSCLCALIRYPWWFQPCITLHQRIHKKEVTHPFEGLTHPSSWIMICFQHLKTNMPSLRPETGQRQ